MFAGPGCLFTNRSPEGHDEGTGSSHHPATPSKGTVEVQILAFNDFHGSLLPPSGSNGQITLLGGSHVEAGGATHLAAHLRALRAQNPNTLVVSAGDLIGASPLTSALFHDEPTILAMNDMGLDIAGVGNHEFDEGPAELLRMEYGGCHAKDGCADDAKPFVGARFPYLGANVFVDADKKKTLFSPYEIRVFEGVPVAFIGLTLEGTPDVTVPSGVSGLSFGDEVDTVNALVPELQNKGIEAIVVLLHEGGLPTGGYDECPGISGAIVDIATRMSPAVDVIASGHTHKAYNCRIAGKLVTSAASFGRLVTDIDLTLSRATGDVIAKEAHNRVITRDLEDPAIGALVERYQSLAAPLAARSVGHIRANLSRVPEGAGASPLGAVVADAQLEATQGAAEGAAQVAFVNPGGVRTDLVFAAGEGEGSDGVVTYAEAFAVQPFGNELVVMTLTGAQIAALLEQQFSTEAGERDKPVILQVSKGFSYTYSQSAPPGSKVDMASIRSNGAPLLMGKPYRVVVNGFLASGGDGFTVLRDGKDRKSGLLDLDALVAYLTQHSPLSPPVLDRIKRAP